MLPKIADVFWMTVTDARDSCAPIWISWSFAIIDFNCHWQIQIRQASTIVLMWTLWQSFLCVCSLILLNLCILITGRLEMSVVYCTNSAGKLVLRDLIHICRPLVLVWCCVAFLRKKFEVLRDLMTRNWSLRTSFKVQGVEQKIIILPVLSLTTASNIQDVNHNQNKLVTPSTIILLLMIIIKILNKVPKTS